MIKKIIVGLIRIYQILISPIVHWFFFSFFGTRAGCRFYPSCSQYAIDSFSNQNFWQASSLVFKRIKKCHPY